MIKSVWKFPLPYAETFPLQMPAGAQLLHVDVQQHTVMLWALVDPHADQETRRFRLAGTGHPIEIPDGEFLVHIGSCLMADGSLVWHLFEYRRLG